MKAVAIRPRVLVALCSAVVIALAMAITLHAQHFPPKASLPEPLRSLAQSHPVDSSCDNMAGDASSDKSKLQNRQKNNFYVTGTPTVITRSVFLRLQQKSDQDGIPHGGPSSMPPDRSVLRNLISVHGMSVGEGTLVRFAAVMIEARHSNTSGGEGVNCSTGGNEDNDIHVDLGQTESDKPCDSLTAEISPHFRPESWDGIEDYEFEGRPLRFTGPLMYDASHTPCRPGKKISPARASIWEIHPVYAIEVCRFKTFSKCRASDDSPWQPLDEWAGENSHKEP